MGSVGLDFENSISALSNGSDAAETALSPLPASGLSQADLRVAGLQCWPKCIPSANHPQILPKGTTNSKGATHQLEKHPKEWMNGSNQAGSGFSAWQWKGSLHLPSR
jgi:hypothetical protein